jgi:hypothetical protein
MPFQLENGTKCTAQQKAAELIRLLLAGSDGAAIAYDVDVEGDEAVQLEAQLDKMRDLCLTALEGK